VSRQEIIFPSDLANAFLSLAKRGLMTPNYLSSLIMLAVLPAWVLKIANPEQFVPLENDENGVVNKEVFLKRSRAHFFYSTYYTSISDSECKYVSLDGLETLEVKHKNPKYKQYEIVFCGNGQDAIDNNSLTRVLFGSKKNYVFWNYPGVGLSSGSANCVDDLVAAGYKQVERLLEDGVAAQDITLNGFSLGGAVATHVASLLHAKGYPVNLTVDRSFSSLAAVPAQKIPQLVYFEDEEGQKPFAGFAPLLPLATTALAFGLLGASLGFVISGLITSLVVMITAPLALIVYAISYCIAMIGELMQTVIQFIGYALSLMVFGLSEELAQDTTKFFDKMGSLPADLFTYIAAALNNSIMFMINNINNFTFFCAAIVGLLIAIPGILSGAIIGLCLGAILSVQLIFTDQPLLMPLTPFFNLIFWSTVNDMNSVSALKTLLWSEKTGLINVINTKNDQVICVEASLNAGIGVPPGQSASDNKNLKGKVRSFWYEKGGHAGPLEGLVTPAAP
jgi:Chlamydia CHLPS protein (DUF818)